MKFLVFIGLAIFFMIIAVSVAKHSVPPSLKTAYYRPTPTPLVFPTSTPAPTSDPKQNSTTGPGREKFSSNA